MSQWRGRQKTAQKRTSNWEPQPPKGSVRLQEAPRSAEQQPRKQPRTVVAETIPSSSSGSSSESSEEEEQEDPEEEEEPEKEEEEEGQPEEMEEEEAAIDMAVELPGLTALLKPKPAKPVCAVCSDHQNVAEEMCSSCGVNCCFDHAIATYAFFAQKNKKETTVEVAKTFLCPKCLRNAACRRGYRSRR